VREALCVEHNCPPMKPLNYHKPVSSMRLGKDPSRPVVWGLVSVFQNKWQVVGDATSNA